MLRVLPCDCVYDTCTLDSFTRISSRHSSRRSSTRGRCTVLFEQVISSERHLDQRGNNDAGGPENIRTARHTPVQFLCTITNESHADAIVLSFESEMPELRKQQVPASNADRHGDN